MMNRIIEDICMVGLALIVASFSIGGALLFVFKEVLTERYPTPPLWLWQALIGALAIYALLFIAVIICRCFDQQEF